MKPGLWPVYTVLVVVQLLFATLPVAIIVALRDMSSPSVAMLRVAGAAVLFLLIWSIVSRERIRSAADYGRLAVYALFGVVANQLLYITALTMTTATAAQTIITAGPAMTLLVAIGLGRETATAAKWAGIALAGVGALLLVGVDLGGSAGLGNALVLLNVASFSVYLVISRDILSRYDPLTVITWVFVFGALGLLPWGAISLVGEIGNLSRTAWLAMAWIILVPTVTGYYLNQWALKRVESSVVAVYVYLQPVATALLAVPLLGEILSPYLVPAGALIFAGVGVTIWAGRRARRRRPIPTP